MTEAELKMFDEALEKKARDLGIKMQHQIFQERLNSKIYLREV